MKSACCRQDSAQEFSVSCSIVSTIPHLCTHARARVICPGARAGGRTLPNACARTCLWHMGDGEDSVIELTVSVCGPSPWPDTIKHQWPHWLHNGSFVGPRYWTHKGCFDWPIYWPHKTSFVWANIFGTAKNLLWGQ